MANKLLSKKCKLGIIGQPPATGAATAFMCIGGTDNNWTNPATAATNFRMLNAEAEVTLPTADITFEQMNMMGQNGIHLEAEHSSVDKAGLHKLAFKMPVDVTTLVPLLVAALQAVSEGVTAADDDTITSGGLTGTIDFAGGGGFLHSLVLDTGIVGDGAILTNAIMDSLTLSIDFNNRGVARYMQASGTFVGNNMLTGQTLSGTFATTTPQWLNKTDTFSFSALDCGAIDLAGIAPRRLEITFNNKVTSSTLTGANVSQFDVEPEIMVKIIVDHTDDTAGILTSFINGDACSFTLANDIATGSAGHLSIAVTSAKSTTNPIVYNGKYLGVELNLRCYSASAATPMTILTNDGLLWGY